MRDGASEKRKRSGLVHWAVLPGTYAWEQDRSAHASEIHVSPALKPHEAPGCATIEKTLYIAIRQGARERGA